MAAKISLVIVAAVAVSAGIGLFAYYNSKHSKKVVEDQLSKRRLTVLNEVFTALFGPRWPFVLIGSAALLTLLMVFVYFSVKKECNLSDEAFNPFTRVLAGFTAMSAVGVALLAARAYLGSKGGAGAIPNYTPAAAEKKRADRILTASSIGLVAVAGILFAIWYFAPGEAPAPRPVAALAPWHGPCGGAARCHGGLAPGGPACRRVRQPLHGASAPGAGTFGTTLRSHRSYRTVR